MATGAEKITESLERHGLQVGEAAAERADFAGAAGADRRELAAPGAPVVLAGRVGHLHAGDGWKRCRSVFDSQVALARHVQCTPAWVKSL